jgi:hypothetical protein
MAQSFVRLAWISVGVNACAANRNQIREPIQVDSQWRSAILAPIAMDLVGAVKGLQVSALGPSKTCLRKN